MYNFVLLIGLIVFGFMKNSDATRELFTRCPDEVKPLGKGYVKGQLVYNNQSWVVSIGGFTQSFLFLNPQFNLREMYCDYGKTRLSIEIPVEFSARTCSYKQDSVEPVIECISNEPKDCIVYCQKRS